MIGYVTLGTDDLERGCSFYDALLGEIGARRLDVNERVRLWSVARGAPMLGIALPFDGQPATAGNGTMVAVAVQDRDTVHRLHARALQLGGVDEGAPGARGAGNFYGGYFRDLDGNKLAVYCLE